MKQLEQGAGQPEALDTFIRETVWERVEALRRARANAAPRPPDRAAESRVALFHELNQALRDPASDRARELARQWRQMIEPETLDAWRRRALWPSGMRRYVASLYETSVESWERVAAFIEAAE
jgi:hypothetical protein